MRKILLFTALICCMMPVMAQKNNDNKILKEMRERRKKVELLNSRANTYTEKLDSLIVANYYREIISYDERLNCKKVNIYNYDSIGIWALNTIYDYEFDSLNRLISSTYKNLSTEYSYRYANKYDDQGRLIETIYWNPIEGIWVVLFRMTLEYDAQGNLSKEIYDYVDENNEWVVDSYYEYNYENEDETQCFGYYWDESTQNFVLSELEVYHYDNQLCTLKEYFSWDFEGSVWLPYSRTEYSYFDNGNLKEETYFGSNDWGAELEPYNRTQFEYDSHNNNTLTRYYMYSEDWVQTRQDENEYDLNVPQTNVAGLSFRYGGYYNDKKLKEREINSDGAIEECVFYYSNAGSGVTENAESLLSIWPNPVSETLNLKGDMTQVQIYSIDGRLVMSLDKGLETINVSALATGSYLLKATLNDGSVTTQKFLKK